MESNRLSGLAPQVISALQESAQASSRGDAERAIASARSAVQTAPDHPEVLRRLALALAARGASAEAMAAIARAVAQRPDDAVLANAQAVVLQVNAQPDAAVDALRRAHALQPASVEIAFNLGRALRDRGDDDDAATLFESILAAMPNHRDARANLAWVLGRIGKSEEAAAHYRCILQRHPDDARVWSGLAELQNVQFDVPEIEAMQRLAAQVRAPEDKVRLQMALGKAFEDRARYAQALENYARANELIRASRRWDAAAHAGEIDKILSAFAKPAAEDSERGAGIVFIVSLPRSGSTLTEQILASHPLVRAGDERLDALNVISEEGRRRGVPLAAWAAFATRDDWTRLGDSYLERIASARGASQVFTDKLPSNWIWLGALLSMLPGARVIDCRRDPLEVAWSCFTQLFADGTQDFSYDFASIGAFWRDYDRSMRHWRENYPQRIRTQVYESLIADPEAQTRALLQFCGLAFDPACLTFYENRRSVRTISASQVRTPLRRDTARAAKYGALLDPLRHALGIERFKNS